MNNYSALQRFLHRSVLSSQLIREIMFDIEQSIFFKKNNNFNGNHVFIAGLARSGTTSLLNAIYQSNEFASLTYNDMPFILAPNLWLNLNFKKKNTKFKERAHGDGIQISSESPEAFEEVFWRTYSKNLDCKNLFKKFISLILKKNHKSRYLSKNNQNIQRLSLISKVFPRSIILIPFRKPIQQAFSLYSQHIEFIKLQKNDKFIRDYMRWIGHSEFGLDYKLIHFSNLDYPNSMTLNHWLEQWYLSYKFLLEVNDHHNQVHLISYESLCENTKVWSNIKDLLMINQDIKFSFNNSIKKIDNPFDRVLVNKCNKTYDSLMTKFNLL